MSLNLQQFAVEDFSGGITDYVLNAQPNQSAELENFLIDPNKRLVTAPGSVIYDPLMYQVPASDVRIGGIFTSLMYPELLINSGKKVWYPNTTVFTEFTGPSGNPAFNNGTASSISAFTEWNFHIYGVNNALSNPTKFYKDGSNVWQTRTAGLPDLASTPSAAPATGTYVFTVTAANATAGATYTNNGVTYTVVTTIAAGTTLTCTAPFGSAATSGTTLTKSSGTGDATITFSSVVSPNNSYLYTFLYHYTYTVGSTVYEDFGPTTTLQRASISAPNTNTVAITGIPVLANGATLNYDTANIKVYIYRTQNNGAVSYKVGEVTNGTTTFNDTMSDATLISQLLLYTNSGVQDNDPPPPCKYVTTVNNTTYYGYVVESGQTMKNRVRQSVQDDPDSCPLGNTIDLLDEVTGLSSYNDNPLVFTKNHVYRLNGAYNELGQGQVSYEDITKTIGCVAHNSIVQTRSGVFWAGNDGFYWTDGFNFKKISDSLNERYKTITSTDTRASKICGTYDTKDNRVIWAVSLDTSNTDNDSFIVLDLRWGIRDASTFVTRTNTTFTPTALTFFNKQLIRGDLHGYIFKHDDQYLTDPTVDTSAVPSLWAESGIVPYYKSTVFNFGMPMVRKWVPKILLTLQNRTNMSVQISGVNDNGSGVSNLQEIRFRGDIVWGDPNIAWGDSSYKWYYINLIEEMRRFLATTLRCSYKQIIITQSFTNIYKSDVLSVGVVDSMAKTVTLSDTTKELPTDIVGYYISLATDGYVNNYLITARNSATKLTYLDTGNATVDGTIAWLIRGQPKGEIIDVLSYVLYFAPLTDQSYRTWRSEQDSSGGNA